MRGSVNSPDIRPVDEEKLSESDVVFYYSREHRLQKASPSVRALYEDAQRPRNATKPRFGIFKSLTDTKSKVLVLTAIILICATALFFPVLFP
ncbi:MAG: hypothetical protein LBH18_04485 [Spirochaetaceae bacterium]|jgi:hypothetical protein|nr:hypothetical protein [Spirochaetaceae bacterium]